MPLLRIRTEIEDRPGRLAVLTAALAARGANILGLTVQVGTEGVVDEFVVDVPSGGAGPDELARAAASAGGVRTAVVPARPRELVDEPTRALALAARAQVESHALPEILAELLRAPEATWIPRTPVTAPTTAPHTANSAHTANAAHTPADATHTASASNAAGTGSVAGAGRVAGTGSVGACTAAEDEGDVLVVRAGRRAVRLRRPGLPFTATEAARADALVRAALPVEPPSAASQLVVLADGTQVTVRPIERDDAGAVRAMHERCSLDSRRMRYFSAKPFPPRAAVERFCEPWHGLTLVAEGPDGSVLALAHLIHVLDPGVAEMAFLVEDAWQGRGLGRALAELLVVLGRERGLVELRATALSENARMRRLLVGLGGRTRRTEEPGIVEIRLRLDGRPAPGAAVLDRSTRG